MKDDGGGNRFLKNKQRVIHLIWTVHFVLIIAMTILLYGCAEFEKLKPVSKDELNRVSGSFLVLRRVEVAMLIFTMSG